MPLTPEQEWIIAACGLIAHADGEFTAGERDQVLVMLDEQLSAEEHARWLALLGDHDALRRAFAELPPPLPAFTEPLLEKAWTMALADGHAGPPEIRELERIAAELGIDPGDLAQWRRHWTEGAVALAEHIATFAALLIHHDGAIDAEEQRRFTDLLGRLPLSDARRERLAHDLHARPPTLDHVGATLASLPRERRLTVLRAIAPLITASSQPALGRAFFLDLARAAALSSEQALRLLGPPA
jgi:tellurite resistance protein